MRILVIEHDAGVREVLISELQDEGFEVFGLENGDGVLMKMSQFKPDVLILDQMNQCHRMSTNGTIGNSFYPFPILLIVFQCRHNVQSIIYFVGAYESHTSNQQEFGQPDLSVDDECRFLFDQQARTSLIRIA